MTQNCTTCNNFGNTGNPANPCATCNVTSTGEFANYAPLVNDPDKLAMETLALNGCGQHTSSFEPVPVTPLNQQVGGNHYKNLAIQPVEYIHKNGIGYMEGCAIKYLTRWRAKNGIEDLYKAIHFIELLIELEEGKENVRD